MWSLNTDWASVSIFTKYAKDHQIEYEACFTNLEKVKRLLDSGHKIGSFHIGFFRSEGNDVYRIGQTGVAGAKETRLYVYPDATSETIYILHIGSKESQKRDINSAKDLTQKIKGSTNEHNTKNERSGSGCKISKQP